MYPAFILFFSLQNIHFHKKLLSHYQLLTRSKYHFSDNTHPQNPYIYYYFYSEACFLKFPKHHNLLFECILLILYFLNTLSAHSHMDFYTYNLIIWIFYFKSFSTNKSFFISIIRPI